MKKLIPILLITVFSISCSEKASTPAPSNGKEFISDHVVSTTVLSSNDVTYINLKNSLAWVSTPKSVIDRLENQNPILVKYNNSAITVIIFSLKSSINFENLVFYNYNDKFLAVVAKSMPEGELTKLAVTDFNDVSYYQFYTNKENKMGKFTVGADIPFGKIVSANNLKVSNMPCTKSTTSFGDCMKCGINECANDWVCAVACGIMAAQCLVGFGIGCGAAQF